MLVEAVDEHSPAASCGIEPDDIILSVNGKNAAGLRAFLIRELLSTPGTTVQLTLQRGDKAFDVELKLPEAELAGSRREIVPAVSQEPNRRLEDSTKR